MIPVKVAGFVFVIALTYWGWRRLVETQWENAKKGGEPMAWFLFYAWAIWFFGILTANSVLAN